MRRLEISPELCSGLPPAPFEACGKPGAIAQLGERLHGMQEVGGSIPPGSTSLRLLRKLRLRKPHARPSQRSKRRLPRRSPKGEDEPGQAISRSRPADPMKHEVRIHSRK